MVCAIYGALLLLNQQTALTIETAASWVFVFPILIYTATSTIQMGAIACVAMAFMSFLFGGFTTWVYSWTSLVTGFVYGIGIQKKWKNMTNFSICLILSIISNYLTLVVWAKIFGMDLNADFESIHHLIPFINFKVFLSIYVVFMGLLQALCIHMVSILICIRLKIEIAPITPLNHIPPSFKAGILSLAYWLFFFISPYMIQYSERAMDIMQILFVLDCFLLMYYGVLYIADFCARHSLFKLSRFVVMGVFIPGINLIYLIMGELDCLLQLRRKREQ
ncbi:MAG: DUF2232 domain-containing protein [Holdemanella sp.]|nr:DUF2232 domain-containing protein [Holdemanella sp.]